MLQLELQIPLAYVQLLGTCQLVKSITDRAVLIRLLLFWFQIKIQTTSVQPKVQILYLNLASCRSESRQYHLSPHKTTALWLGSQTYPTESQHCHYTSIQCVMHSGAMTFQFFV